MRQLNIRITDEQDKYIRKQAKKKGMSAYQYGQDLMERAVLMDQLMSEKLDLIINTTIQAYTMSAVLANDKDPALYQKAREQALDAIKRLKEEA